MIIAGLVMLALGCLVTPLDTSGIDLVAAVGLQVSMGSGLGSFSVLNDAGAQSLPPECSGAASGIINAGGSFGQLAFAPALQKLIRSLGWMGAVASMALVGLATVPLVGRVTGAQPARRAPRDQHGGLKQATVDALRNSSHLLLHAGFFTRGFHIAFLVTRLPGEVGRCGLPSSVASWPLALIGGANIVGSLVAGCFVAKYRSKYNLSVMYASRTLLILWYLMMPRTEWTFYLIAVGLGLTWLATVPRTASNVGRLFGTRYLATLFGLTLLPHQIGGFPGAWLGGIAMSRFGNFRWVWYADMALSAPAALINLPIREAPVLRACSCPA